MERESGTTRLMPSGFLPQGVSDSVSSGKLNSSVEMGRHGPEARNMLGDCVTQEDSRVFDIHSTGEFGKAVATHQQVIVGRDSVEIFIAEGSAVLQADGHKPFTFGLGRIQLHPDTAHREHGPT